MKCLTCENEAIFEPIKGRGGRPFQATFCDECLTKLCFRVMVIKDVLRAKK